ncbi:MAG: hypothetical protein ABIO19_11445 [Burkholderiaceae bacterium]
MSGVNRPFWRCRKTDIWIAAIGEPGFAAARIDCVNAAFQRMKERHGFISNFEKNHGTVVFYSFVFASDAQALLDGTGSI